ncbi:MAG TPA: hypothetical protein ENI86_02630 [Acidimicrobiales bacterium]|nr:hypothetical protein [Acidimicrobiales bacterium]
MEPEVSTVADDEVVIHVGEEVRRYRDLEPDRAYRFDGVEARTLPRPGGELLATIATVNDLHFGEVECGHSSLDMGPILSMPPGSPPHPEVMNRAAAEEIAALGPDVLIARGDLTDGGRPEQFEAFEAVYGALFADSMYMVRGNHEGYGNPDLMAHPVQHIVVPGVDVVLMDTAVAGETRGHLDADQIGRMEDIVSEAEAPVIVMGHHPPRTDDEVVPGLDEESTVALAEAIGRHRGIVAYSCGHSHRNKVTYRPESGGVPYVQVASVKDFPGSWAEIRVFEGGLLHIHRRISSPDALAWTNRTRQLFGGLYPRYSMGRLSDRCLALGNR